MTELDPLIKAFVKTLEEANIITTNTSDLTSTQFECFTPQCLRVVMDSFDIEAGTVIVVGAWEAMRVIGNGSHNEKAWVGFDGRMYTHEEFANTVRSTHDVVRVVHYGVI
jgi:hypothetical protein|nr:MAG TPA: hypothetical protein [Caudoviricetes sp.]